MFPFSLASSFKHFLSFNNKSISDFPILLFLPLIFLKPWWKAPFGVAVNFEAWARNCSPDLKQLYKKKLLLLFQFLLCFLWQDLHCTVVWIFDVRFSDYKKHHFQFFKVSIIIYWGLNFVLFVWACICPAVQCFGS